MKARRERHLLNGESRSTPAGLPAGPPSLAGKSTSIAPHLPPSSARSAGMIALRALSCRVPCVSVGESGWRSLVVVAGRVATPGGPARARLSERRSASGSRRTMHQTRAALARGIRVAMTNRERTEILCTAGTAPVAVWNLDLATPSPGMRGCLVNWEGAHRASRSRREQRQHRLAGRAVSWARRDLPATARDRDGNDPG
jgi:hypothetical protein